MRDFGPYASVPAEHCLSRCDPAKCNGNPLLGPIEITRIRNPGR